MEAGFGMPGLRQAAAMRSAGGGSGSRYTNFKVDPGKSETVRFLDTGQEIEKQWCFMHDTPPKGNQKFGDPVPCRDQAQDGVERCPGCERGIPRKIIGFANVIWRNGPVYGTRDDGSPNWKDLKGRADVLAVWRMGVNRLEELDAIDTKYRGITTRDFDIARNTATGFDTRYRIDPHMDETGSSVATPLNDIDVALAAKKPDLRVEVVPMSYEAMEALFSGGGVTSGNDSSEEADFSDAFQTATDASPWAKN